MGKTLSSSRYDCSLVIACYNEEKLLKESVEAIISTLAASIFSYEFIFADDKSRDGTRKIIASLVKKNKNFRAVYHDVNQGRGKTVRDGIAVAKGKVVGFIDVDLEVSPVYIPSFVRMILDGKADVVTGLRIYREGAASLHRAILSRGYSWLVRATLGIPLKDTETGYKFFDRKKILPVVKKDNQQRLVLGYGNHGPLLSRKASHSRRAGAFYPAFRQKIIGETLTRYG